MFKMSTNWTLGSAISVAVLAAAMAFPKISAQAADQREAAAWNDMASEYLVAERTAALAEAVPTPINYEIPSANQVENVIATAKFTAAEQKCLAEAVYYEARSETRSGQKAVAEVVLNRVASKHFPSTICGVVYEGSERSTGCQFSFTCDGSMDIAPKGKSWTRSNDVATLVMTGGVTPFTNRATHYHTTAIKPKWSDNLRMTKRVGSHVFYRFAPRDYQPSVPTMVTIAPPS